MKLQEIFLGTASAVYATTFFAAAIMGDSVQLLLLALLFAGFCCVMIAECCPFFKPPEKP